MGSAFSKTFNPRELPDLQGKVIIVTGGNSGIGFATVQHLARHGAKVYLAARSEKRANLAIERLHAAGFAPGNGHVVWLPLDYSNPWFAKRAAESFMVREERLDAIVNCAALMLTPYQKTNDGIQDIVMVNYIGPFVFIGALLPLLKRTAKEPNSDVRIVEISSQGHRTVPKGIRFCNIDDFNMEFKESAFQEHLRYGLSKLMGVLHVKELQRRLDENGIPIIVMSVHPGIINTDGVQDYAHSVGPILSPIYSFIAKAFFKSPKKGAYSPVFAAVAPTVRAEPNKYRGAYIVPPGKLGSSSKQSQDPQLARELWETTEKIISEIGLFSQGVVL